MRKLQHFLLGFRNLLKNRKLLVVYLPLFLLIFALPLVIIFLQKKQQANQYASAASNDLYVSISGSDANSCTQASPCLTISHVSTLATPGTTVHVAPGTYNFNASEPIRTSTSGIAGNPITYVSDTKWGAKLVNSWYQAGGGATWYNTSSYIVIKGFEISGGGGIDGLIDFGSHNTISGNYVHDMNNDTSVLTCLQLGSGGIFLGGDGDTVIGNVVRHIGPPGIDTCITTHGFYISSGSSNVIVNNIASNNSGFGIHCWGPSSVTVDKNVSFNNGTGGMIFGNGNGTFDNSIISNNIAINNGVWGIRELENTGTHEVGPNNKILNNMVYGNPNGNMLLIEGNTDSGTITADAQFINYQADGSGDYHLKATSPAIDAGISTGAPATDFDGNTRPQGAGLDIGAYEYVVAATPGLVFDAASTNNAQGATTLTWTHTTGSQNNRLLVVSVQTATNPTAPTVNSITYNSTPLTKAGRINGNINGVNTEGNAEIWYLVNPAAGANTIQVNLSATATDLFAAAETFNNVDQTTPVGTAVTTNNGNIAVSPMTLAIPGTNSNQMIVDSISEDNGVLTVSPNQTQINNQIGSLSRGAASYRTGAASNTTMSWTPGSADTYAMVGVPINPVAATPTNTPIPTNTPTPVLDTSPPSVSITSPLSGTTVSTGSKITISASATDNVGVTEVDFYVSGLTNPVCSDTAAPYTCSWTVPGTNNVTYTITTEAFDAAGNGASNSVLVTAVKHKKISVSG
jgi:parallel beta-helix repeat protein